MSAMLSQRTKGNTERCFVKRELCVLCASHSCDTAVSDSMHGIAELSCAELFLLADDTNL